MVGRNHNDTAIRWRKSVRHNGSGCTGSALMNRESVSPAWPQEYLTPPGSVHDLAMPRSLLHAGHLPGPATASTTNWRPTPQRWRSRLASLSGCHPIGRHDSAASTGNADCAPAHVLMVPRCPACSPVPTCGRFAWCSSRGEPWVSRAIHWPGAPGLERSASARANDSYGVISPGLITPSSIARMALLTAGPPAAAHRGLDQPPDGISCRFHRTSMRQDHGTGNGGVSTSRPGAAGPPGLLSEPAVARGLAGVPAADLARGAPSEVASSVEVKRLS
jgi:hypothetical protein